MQAQAVASVTLVLALLFAGCASAPQPVTVTQTKTSTTTATTTATTTTQVPVFTTTSTTTSSTTTTSPTTTTTSTAPGIRPAIDNVTVGSVDQTGAKVRWTLNGSDDAQSRLEYGIGGFTRQGPLINGTGNQVTDLVGLSSCSNYQVRVRAVGGGFTVLSESYAFRTLGTPASVSAISTSRIMHESLQIHWTVSGADDAKSYVEYSTDLTFNQATPSQAGTGAKTATLTQLAANAQYNFRIIVQSACGNAVSSTQTFRTAMLVSLEIFGAAGPASYGRTGQATGGPVTISLNGASSLPMVFRVHNRDAQVHGWNLKQGSTTLPVSLPTLASDQTLTTGSSLDLSAGTYTMYCNHHSGMDTTLYVTA